MEENNATKMENPLERINLQAIISTYHAQRQDMLPQDQLQKIEWAFHKEFSKDSKIYNQYSTQGIMTLQDLDPKHSPKEKKKRGRQMNIGSLKDIRSLLIN